MQDIEWLMAEIHLITKKSMSYRHLHTLSTKVVDKVLKSMCTSLLQIARITTSALCLIFRQFFFIIISDSYQILHKINRIRCFPRPISLGPKNEMRQSVHKTTRNLYFCTTYGTIHSDRGRSHHRNRANDQPYPTDRCGRCLAGAQPGFGDSAQDTRADRAWTDAGCQPD